MNLRLSTIVTPKSYAQTALFGEVNDWIRTHKGFEIPVAETKDLEHLARGTAGKGIGVDPEYEVLFSQIRKHLTERDRHILVLLEQNLHKPKEIAAALHISYDAAAKALQRVRERVARILNGTRNTSAVNADLPTGRPARKHLK
jgi:DNA-directed RNA polymerase specialized sigma24 family protein